MQFDAHCIECLIKRQFQLAHAKHDGELAYRYMRDVLQCILDAPKGVAAPWLVSAFSEHYAKYWPGEDPYDALKKDSNDLVMSMLPKIRALVEQAPDSLGAALRFARVGNFLDFGILTPETARQALNDAIDQTPDSPLDEALYAKLKQDLSHAENLLILGDNAGEIVFDTLLVEQLQKHYPALHITYCVRGKNALNDATRADAAYVGMDRLAHVIDNGSAISGTEIAYAGPALQEALNRADVILAKGVGNMECMVGCGLNVYYVFMSKCRRIAQLLGVELMTGQFLRELELPPLKPLAD